MAFTRELPNLTCIFTSARQTRKVKVPANLELDRGEAVEITTQGNGTALDEVGALTVVANLEGYLLNRIDTTNGTPCEADVVYRDDSVNRNLVLAPAVAMADLIPASRKVGLPLIDNQNIQGVNA